jgi:hypothetical protein
MAYLAYGSSSIAGFFKDFIAKGSYTRTTLSLSANYVPVYLFIATILVVTIAAVIFILMRQKKKPTLFYIVVIGFYVGLIFYLFYISGVLNGIEIETPEPRTLRVIRDLASIMSYVQYALIVLVGIRAVGFDIKKFNFGEDLAELEIDVSDNEEFELTVGIDPDKIGRGFRKSKRELKYFIVENLFVFTSISTIIIIIIVTTIVLNIKVYNRVYNQGEAFRAGSYVCLVNSTYITSLDQRGEVISPSGKKYAILNISFSNTTAISNKIYLDDISLIDRNNIYKPILNFYASFIDLGEGYKTQIIEPGSTENYIIVFEVNNDVDLDNLYLRYADSIEVKKGVISFAYRRARLDAKFINKITIANSSSMNNTLWFSDSPLEKNSLTINEFKFGTSFPYNGRYCINDVCNNYTDNISMDYTSTQGILMKLVYTYDKNSNTTLANSNSLLKLINTYGLIRYSYDNKIYITKLINRTPTDQVGNDLYFQLPSNSENAKSLELLIRIREKEFVYKLK